MKRYWLLLVFVLGAIPLWAGRVWTVQTVPNTRLEDNRIHVADPDDILSDSCEQLINTSLHSIRDKADVFIVALNSIGDANIETFANELFNYWGIGEEGKDNGVLILLAKEQRELKFEVGYGAEQTMTDARCQQIFTEHIVPFFKEGDYQSGLCSGVNQVLETYGAEIPAGLITTLPYKGGSTEDEEMDLPMLLLVILFIALPVLGLVVYANNSKGVPVSSLKVSSDKVIDGVRYIDVNSRNWNGNPWTGLGCLKALMYGLSLPLFVFLAYFTLGVIVGDIDKVSEWSVLFLTLAFYLTWSCFRQNQRALRAANKVAHQSLAPRSAYVKANAEKLTRFTRWTAIWIGWIYMLVFKRKIEKSPEYCCAECQSEMRPFLKFPYSEKQRKEQELKSVEYEPYICQYGHAIVFRKQVGGTFTECPACHAITDKATSSKTIKEPTYQEAGQKVVDYECKFCGYKHSLTVDIPKLVHYTSSYSSGGSSYSSSSSTRYRSSSSRSSGGSFGGGRSGGGGYKGSW